MGDRDELKSALPEAEEHVDVLDTLLDHLARIGVPVLDEEEIDDLVNEAPSSENSGLEGAPFENLLDLYLVEMAQEPLLSSDEEVALAQQIERGRQAEKALRETDYTSEEYAQLKAQVEAGQAARERLSRANARLVVSIAKRYRGYGNPFLDLIQDGNEGLMRAIDRYDPNRGFRFSTYATWWIRQTVTRSLANHSRVIRIPVHLSDRMRKMARVAQRLEIALGRQPSPEEIAAEMRVSLVRVQTMMRWTTQPFSLEQAVNGEGGSPLGDFIEDENPLRPEEVTDTHLLSQRLDGVLGELTPRQARVLRLRYGLEDGRTRTLREVAEKFDLSRERIRQIEREALLKVRLVAPKYGLEHFLTDN